MIWSDDMNSIIIHGRITRDIEMVYTNNDKPIAIAKFAVAVDRNFKDKNGEKVTDFFNCVSFGKQAEVFEKYFKKGDGITIQGEMQNNRYKNKEGENRDKWEIKIDKFDFELLRKGENNSSPNTFETAENQSFYVSEEEPDDEDLPF